jgi:uncharacterized coiled-coil DUF342 family protein
VTEDRLNEIKLEFEMWFCSNDIIKKTSELLTYIDKLRKKINELSKAKSLRNIQSYIRSMEREIGTLKLQNNKLNDENQVMRYALDYYANDPYFKEETHLAIRSSFRSCNHAKTALTRADEIRGGG